MSSISHKCQVLVFTRTLEYVHASIPKAVSTLKELGELHNWNVVTTDDPTVFSWPALRQYDVIIFVSTSGDVLNAEQLEAFKQFMGCEDRKGWVGIHGAADTLYSSQWYHDLVGASFTGHPPIQKGTLTFHDTTWTELGLEAPDTCQVEDEWYNFSVNVAKDPHFTVIASVDENSYHHESYEKPQWNGTRMGNPHPISWCHSFGQGRAFYTANGHLPAVYDQTWFRDLLASAVNWAAFRPTPACGPGLKVSPRYRALELEMVHNIKKICKVHIQEGCLKKAETYAWMIPRQSKKAQNFLLVDSNVNVFYGDLVMKGFLNTGIKMHKIVVAAGEASKCRARYNAVVKEIVNTNVEKQSVIVSLGGGMIENLAGFAAATIHRGLPLIHIATSLLSQIDAALDVKQAINLPYGKNLMGAMYCPSAVIIDTDTLATLPDEEMANGMGEVTKHALTQDRAFFSWLMGHTFKELRDSMVMQQILERTAALKVGIVNGGRLNEKDEAIPQYGHAFAHAIEHASDYRIRHGEAVAIGMCLTAEAAYLLGWCNKDVVQQHYELARRYNLPVAFPGDIDMKRFEAGLLMDKYTQNGVAHMLTLQYVGEPFFLMKHCVLPMSMDTIYQAIKVNQTRCGVSVIVNDSGLPVDTVPVRPPAIKIPEKPTPAVVAIKAQPSPFNSPTKQSSAGLLSFRVLFFLTLLSILLSAGVQQFWSDLTFITEDFTIYKQGDTWINWAKTVQCKPSRFFQPNSQDDIVGAVHEAVAKGVDVHVVGSGHSLSNIACSDESILLNLDKYNRLLRVNTSSHRVTFQAGVRLAQISEDLAKHGLAIGVLPAIHVQSIAGAIATGTHGSSAYYGSLSSLVTQLSLVMLNGTVVKLSPTSHPHLFHAATMSMGTIGIISEVELQCEPAFDLTATIHPALPMSEYWNGLSHFVYDYEYSSAMYLPYAKKIVPVTMTKSVPNALNRTEHSWRGSAKVNFVMAMQKVEAKLPFITPYVHPYLGAYAFAPGSRTGVSNKIFAITLPNHYSTDAEYFVSLDVFPNVYEKIVQELENGPFNLNIFLMIRYVKGDDSLLSYCDKGTVCVSMSFYILFQNTRNNAALRSIESIVLPYGARPHLGKMHCLTADLISQVFPNWLEFARIQKSVDPRGHYLTKYTRALLHNE